MDTLVLIFVTLFVTQTMIFYVLLRKANMHKGVTSNPGSYDAITNELAKIKETLSRIEDRLNVSNGTHNTLEKVAEEDFNQTCYRVLELLKTEGPSSSSELSIKLNRSREHVSRILKNLYIKGLVTRTGKPFKYRITDKGLSFLENAA
ncbi:MAG: MarR family transcriptional regulator [Thaumarchaeota archaeon]|nr:MarR family transcriptional regulator [Candidatus Terraquivivens yellowstonensis]MCL7392394.1 MarR family transcriptional regulator [Candidatus Terraquivivens yellowstonensis]MCL7397862.1 MarR family transcriptional regulator [Candidatus Terraquivivens yellowstonensis]MCL7400567.1 MarR family transcriptional regulator [Candidatus Terraquivivens yellowstonensis]